MQKDKVIVICGPTASGKTALSIELAKQINGEIVSCDSMQIYKDMNIGTAKPTEEEQKGIKHYLIDFVSPDERYSVADYKQDAKKAIKEILKKGKVPIVVGGTGLYIDSLIYEIEYPNIEFDEKYRKKLENKYSVKIVYKDENGNYLIGGSINTEKLNDDNEINRYLKEVESTLKKYPNGFFKEMKDNNVSLRIYMVNKIDGGHSGMTDGRNQSNITVTIGTAGTNLFEYTLHHELMHYIDIYMRHLL